MKKLSQDPFYLAIYRNCLWSCALYAWFGGSAMIRFLILAGYFELTMYLQLSGKLNQYINLHYSYLAYISMFLSFCFSSCAADHLGQADEDPQSSLASGQSGEYFLLSVFLCLSGYFSLQ